MFCKKVFLKIFFGDFEAILGFFGGPWPFWVRFGGARGVQKGVQNQKGPLSTQHLGAKWALEGFLGLFWVDLKGLAAFLVDSGVILNGLGDSLGRLLFSLMLFPATPDTRHNTTHTQHQGQKRHTNAKTARTRTTTRTGSTATTATIATTKPKKMKKKKKKKQKKKKQKKK